jgi:hypothetical protein
MSTEQPNVHYFIKESLPVFRKTWNLCMHACIILGALCVEKKT